jgi:hypothetical protein
LALHWVSCGSKGTPWLALGADGRLQCRSCRIGHVKHFHTSAHVAHFGLRCLPRATKGHHQNLGLQLAAIRGAAQSPLWPWAYSGSHRHQEIPWGSQAGAFLPLGCSMARANPLATHQIGKLLRQRLLPRLWPRAARACGGSRKGAHPAAATAGLAARPAPERGIALAVAFSELRRPSLRKMIILANPWSGLQMRSKYPAVRAEWRGTPTPCTAVRWHTSWQILGWPPPPVSGSAPSRGRSEVSTSAAGGRPARAAWP